MVAWKSEEVMGQIATVMDRLMHGLLGLYTWELLISLDFEWDFIHRKKTFRWPMLFYFSNRYLQLLAIIATILSFDLSGLNAADCTILFKCIAVARYGCTALSSANLAIRTIVIWDYNSYIIGTFSVGFVAQVALIILCAKSVAGSWSSVVGCIPHGAEQSQAGIYICTMCFNSVVLLLTTYKLIRSNKHSQHPLGQSKLTRVIFADGLIFFIVALLSDVLVIVFIALDLNRTMTLMFQPTASLISTIAACRVVRRLMNFQYAASVALYTVQGYPSKHHKGTHGNTFAVPSAIDPRAGVHCHIQMQTFTHVDDSTEKKGSASSSTRREPTEVF